MGGRSSKQQEVEHREVSAGCCACFGKVMCSIILAVVLIITAALSATALLACRYQFWTFLQDASVSPVYTLRSGWMEFTHTASNYNISSAQGTLNSNFTGAVDHAFSEFQQTKGSLLQGGNPKLTEVSQDLYIIGLIAAAACALSVIMGVIYFLFTLCGGAGSHICCAAVPVGIIVIGMQLAYYGAAAIKIRDYTNKDTHGRSTYTPVPDWGWILETVAGVLWLIIAAVSACVPAMRRREVVVHQPMGAMTGQGPPGPGAPARYSNIDAEQPNTTRYGTARRGRAY